MIKAAPRAVLLFACLLALVLASSLPARLALPILSADLASTPDEAGHFTTGVFFYDYVHEGFPFPPAAYAKSYYARYPKVSIGHWPPFYYLVQGAWFSVAGVSLQSSRILSGLILAALAAAVFFRGRALYGLPGAACAAAATLATPAIFQSAWLVMSDLLLSLFVFLSVMALCDAVETGSVPSAVSPTGGMGSAALPDGRAGVRPLYRAVLKFTLFAAAAILTKGSGWAIGLFAAVFPILAVRPRIYAKPWYWLSGAAVLTLAAPFYWYVDKLGIGYPVVPKGFARTAGSGFRVPRNEWAFFEVVPWLLFAAAAIGLILAFRNRRVDDGRLWRRLGAPFVVLASLVPFHLVLHLSWDPRLYMPCVALMALAAGYFAAWLCERSPVFPAAPVLACAAIVAAVPATEPYYSVLSGYGEAVRGLPAEATVLVSSPGAIGEGAVVVARLLGDRDRRGVVLRSSKVLGVGNWNGNGYRLLFPDEPAIDRFLGDAAVHWIVIEEGDASPPHHALLQKTMAAYPARYRLARRQPLEGRRVLVYENIAAAGRPGKPVPFSLGLHRGGMIVGESDSGTP